MGHAAINKIVFTVKDRCRVCYTCVRECPVKAIKIINGQAEVIHERCIGCGNCVIVCSQGAKVFLDTKQQLMDLFRTTKQVIAMIAPSFPAEFYDIDNHRKLVGMLKELGFYKVVEVAFGADLVAREYQKILSQNQNKTYISSDCPAIVFYVEQYYPELIDALVPVASPMTAMHRVVKKMYGEQVKTVFIGPCLAKKKESDEIDLALTFKELRELFMALSIKPSKAEAVGFDPPVAGKGSVFPVSRGMLQNIGKEDSIVEGDTIVAEGKKFKEVICEFAIQKNQRNYLELLCCEGCIMGAGMSKSNGLKRFARRAKVSEYVKQKLSGLDRKQWENSIDCFADIDLSQHFTARSIDKNIPDEKEINRVLRQMGKRSPGDFLNCGACGYDTCREHAIAIIQGLAEEEMCLPFLIEKLHETIYDLNVSHDKLANIKQALRQSEKLASMGQLSAGIAHELNNPLGVITMYANILKEETDESDPIAKDLDLIVEQADRCKKIVGGLLNFARKNQVKLSEVNIETFCKHSLESVIIPENVNTRFQSSVSDPVVFIDKDQMMQVLTNLEKNSIEAMPKGGTLTLKLSDTEQDVTIAVSDTGTGISAEHTDKIFTPFFSTKGIGKGTGLGLPLIYGIIKMHKGKISFETNADPAKGATGTTFIITIPRNKPVITT